ncbi:MAG: DUF885 domain-containing protein [Labilithrix sp.]|nr:DUF885 domain-containing protein [Labilithrix sp.]
MALPSIRASAGLVAALFLSVGLPVVGACGGHRGASAPSGPSEPARRLHALFAEEWEHEMREHPVWASELGDMRGAALWDDVGLTAETRRAAHDKDVLARLDAIPRGGLSREDALSYDLFRRRYEEAVAGQAFRLYLFPINQRGGVQTADEVADALPFTTAKHFEDWNARLTGFPRYMDQTIELLREGARTGMTHPKVVMRRVVAQIDKQIVTDPTKSPFFAPYQRAATATAATSVSAAERERLASEAKRAISEAVVPAFEKLKELWTTTYLPACKDEVGAWQLPNGRALYAYLVRAHTTTSLTPDEVHAIGLREVARIRGEMEAAKAKAGFKGSLKELWDVLRTDPAFYFADGAELLVAYRDLAKRIDPLLVKVFRKLPRTPYGVSPIPAAIAPDTTTAYYRPPAADGSRAGTYFVNLYEPRSRPKWEMTALTLHEAVPGHHLQIALAMEQEDLPQFRRHGDYTAFVEGWALYAESLGEEMGVYDDPYSKLGQLTYEMWRAVRLVVDTGIHHLKWDRQRAIDFFLENAAKSELDVVNEIDRYIAWPGQALAYKIGELEISKLRREEAARLGAAFDLKAFHEAVLRSGPLPLDVLAREVRGADRRAPPAPSSSATAR